ncbi:reprolysin-like metallopeptidase [Streptomyces crystallinus]|uniref:Bacterial repeat domain-containing protein n=1 Tax=Streptomyces crystallinus TaxID=68191 RepID=A0ABN1FRG8_9ACTN
MPRPRRLFHGVLAAAVLTPALPAVTAAAEGPTPGAARLSQVEWAEGSFRSLCGPRRGAAPDRRALRFFDDAPVEAVASRITRDRQGTVLWTGHLADRPDRPVTLAVDGACGQGVPRVAGEVHLGSRRYVIDADRPGASTVRELPFAGAGHPHDDAVRVGAPRGPLSVHLAQPAPRPTPHPASEPKPRPRAAVTAPVIDLLIGYTPQTVRNTQGGVAALDLKVKAAVAGTNAAYADSTVTARLNLLGTFTTKEWAGDDGDPFGMTSALSDPESPRYSGAFATDARRRRDEQGADLLHVLTQFTPQPGTVYTAGAGNTPALPRIVPGASASYRSDGEAFGAQQVDTLGTYHLAHEIGHNFGLNHDYLTDPVDRSDPNYRSGNLNPYYPDNHGYLPADRTWTDIMGYTMACADAARCETKLWFSNPRQTYGNAPRGVPLGQPGPADCVRVMNLTGPVLANYRTPAGASGPAARYALAAAPDTPDRGTVAVAQSGLFDKGDQVTVTAAAKAGFKLDYWAVDGRIQPTRANELAVTMDGDHLVTARFIGAAATLARLPATTTTVPPAATQPARPSAAAVPIAPVANGAPTASAALTPTD